MTLSHPFLHSGVDYAKPLTLKTWRGKNDRTNKDYIVLFICLSTSAVHIEFVSDYLGETFIAAYKRFTGRRGICSVLFSDYGTNFVEANSKLKRLFSVAIAESQKMAALLVRDSTQWKFNPPSAPHFGCKWEAGVKSVKYRLKE